MGITRRSFLELIALGLAGCTAPGEATYLNKKIAYNREEGLRAESEGMYATNAQNTPEGFKKKTSNLYGRLEGLNTDVEFLECDIGEGFRNLYMKLKGNPAVTDDFVNVFRSRGDYTTYLLAWSLADGTIRSAKAHKGIRNRKSGYTAETETFYTLKRGDNLSVVAITDEKDGKIFDMLGIKRLELGKYAQGLPADFDKYLLALRDKKKAGESINSEVEEFSRTISGNKKNLALDILTSPAYGIAPRQDEVARALKDLAMRGKIAGYDMWAPMGGKYQLAIPFKKITENETEFWIPIDMEKLDNEVSAFLADPEGKIKGTRLMRGKIGKK